MMILIDTLKMRGRGEGEGGRTRRGTEGLRKGEK